MRCRAKVVVIGVVLPILCACTTGSPRPSAGELLHKSLVSYDGAKTFQGDVEFAMQEGAHRTQVLLRVLAENNPNGEIARSSLTVQTISYENPGRSTTTQQFIDDGTTVYSVYPDQKQYTAGPRGHDKVSGLFRRTVTNLQHQWSSFAVEVRQVNNRPTYVLHSKSTDGLAKILIDRDTLHLQGIHTEGGKASARRVVDVKFSNQVFDAPIPAETFVWKAPAGFTKAAAGEDHSP